MVKWVLSFFIFFNSLFALVEFKGLVGRPLDLVSLFLSSHPIIFVTQGYETELLDYFPRAHIINSTSKINSAVDLFRIHLDGPDDWTDLPLNQAKVIYLDAIFDPFQESVAWIKLKHKLEEVGFSLLRKWNHEGAHTSFIFVKNDCFYTQETANYLKQHSLVSSSYEIYDSVYFCSFAHRYGWVRFYVDNDLEDSVKGILRTGFPYEGNLSLMIHELTKPNTIAIDIGAHIGVHTLFMSRKVGPHGAVISFEPNRKLYMEHLANMELNQCSNVIPISKGLGNSVTKVYQKKIEIEQNDPIEGVGDYIDIVPLDSYYINDISLIKLDVENYEYFVLQGAKETILRNKPVILFECWIGYDYEVRDRIAQKKNFERVISLLESYGYEIRVLYNCDFIAIPRETTDPLLGSYKRKYKLLDVKTYQGEASL